MRYVGTVAQGELIETAVKDTGNFSIRKEGRKPDPASQAPGQHTAHASVYELYLDKKAKAALNPGAYLDILLFPHAVVRIMYLPRDDRAEIKVGNDKIARVCAAYPKLAGMLSEMQCENGNGKAYNIKHLTT